VDFIQLPYWAIFNIADMAVVISGATIAILLLRGYNINGTRGAK
jgi:signal peptidase II